MYDLFYTLSRSGCTSHRTFLVPVSSWSQRCKQTPVSTSQAQEIWSVRFFSLAIFPTVSQTSAAKALAISMEAPLGNARDAAEERRLAQRRECQGLGVSTKAVEHLWLLRTQEALANRSQVKPVQFPGALTREEHAYCGSQGLLHLFDPCRLVLFLACCATGSNRSNLAAEAAEVGSYLYGARKHVSGFPKLPSRQCSAFRVLGHLLRFHSLPLFRCLQSSRRLKCQAKIPRVHWWHALWTCASLGAGAAGTQGSNKSLF